MTPCSSDPGGACAAVILAAGKGTRMKSDRPKVMHVLAGRELVRWVIAAARAAGLDPVILVVGHQAESVREALADEAGLRFVLQAEQLGTGHAVQMAAPALEGRGGEVVILAGDVPLIRAETLRALVDHHRARGAAATVLTAELDDPAGYGRILRDAAGNVAAIREHRDASAAERAVREVNSGIYCFRVDALLAALRELRADNDQAEYYLTDTLAILREAGEVVAARLCGDPVEIAGVNDRAQLASMERRVTEGRT
ncbi:MAG: NTP transferase domain-containing protein [Candidatus Krumholzibacteriota bacterium]|nr:NTP transferase domain-containing protein [Candidatus Krumholzibacteriota bacterium]